MKRVASGLPIALLKMREGGTGKFDIHKGHWLNVVQVSRRAEPYHSHTAERSKRAAWLVAYGTFEMCRPTPPMSVQGTDRIDRCISKLTRMDPEQIGAVRTPQSEALASKPVALLTNVRHRRRWSGRDK
jgi:hypothetical protein